MFGLRGAGTSGGKSSWTGKPELWDCISFVGFLIYYINGLNRPHPVEELQASPFEISGLSHVSSSAEQFRSYTFNLSLPGMLLVLGGYSYGSLIISHLPTTSVILEMFANVSRGTAAAEIRLRALKLSAQRNAELDQRGDGCQRQNPVEREKQETLLLGPTISVSREETGHGSRESGEEFRASRQGISKCINSSRKTFGLQRQSNEVGLLDVQEQDRLPVVSLPIPQTCYLLISPLLPPVSHLLTMFSNLKQESPSENHTFLSKWTRPSSALSDSMLTTYSTMAVYGTSDFFASQTKLRKWAENLMKQPSSLFQRQEVDSAGHFWQEVGAIESMVGHIQMWLQGVAGEPNTVESASH